MMKTNKMILMIIFMTIIFCFSGQSVCVAQENGSDIVITMQRLSDRTLVLSETLMGNNVVAVASEKGIVVIDDSGLPSTADKMRRIIEMEFGRNDFAYVINTHSHWDHSFGNQVFHDADIVGHEKVTTGMKRDQDMMPRRISNLEQRLQNEADRLHDVEPGSEEARKINAFLASLKRQLNDFKNVWVSTPPNITFADRMVLNLGDITMKLEYFGRAHSTADILIHVPEEGILMTGDLFLDQRWVPLFAGQPVLDIDRWLAVLHRILDGDEVPSIVIPGHMDLWDTEKLVLWRDYIKTLWEDTKKAKSEGLILDQVKQNLPLQEPYFYLRDRGHSEERILTFHSKNIEAFWKQLFISNDEKDF